MFDGLGKRIHVFRPQRTFLKVAARELPVLGRVVDALQKAPALLIFSYVEHYLKQPVAVLPKVALKVADLAIPDLEELLVGHVKRSLGHLVSLAQVVDSHHQYILVVRAVKEANMTTLGQVQYGPPEVVVRTLGAGWLLEAVDRDALRVEPGHDALDGRVFAGGIEGLEHDDYALTPICIETVLQIGHAQDVLLSKGLVVLAFFFGYLDICRVVTKGEGALSVIAIVIKNHSLSLPFGRYRDIAALSCGVLVQTASHCTLRYCKPQSACLLC